MSVIIVNWHSAAYLRECLASVVAQSDDVPYEIIVIDSGSYDGARAMLDAEFPFVRFIQATENLGFARANNAAAVHARGDVLVFLNPDTALLTPSLRPLCDQLGDLPRAGVLGPTLLNSDRSLQTSCVLRFPTIASYLLDMDLLHRWRLGPRPWDRATGDAGVAAVDAVSGACLCIRRSVFEELGGFCEDYFMYVEDVDLAYRAALAGYTNYFMPDVAVLHHGGTSAGRASSVFAAVMLPEAVVRFLRRYRGAGYARLFRCSLAAASVSRLALIGLLAPVWAWTSHQHSMRATFAKWQAILRWSCGHTGVVDRYYPRHSGAGSR